MLEYQVCALDEGNPVWPAAVGSSSFEERTSIATLFKVCALLIFQFGCIQCTAIVTRMFNLVHTLHWLAEQLQLDLVHESFSLGDEVSV